MQATGQLSASNVEQVEARALSMGRREAQLVESLITGVLKVGLNSLSLL